MKIYILKYSLEGNEDHDDVKILGAYSTIEKARDEMARYIVNNPIFRKNAIDGELVLLDKDNNDCKEVEKMWHVYYQDCFGYHCLDIYGIDLDQSLAEEDCK